MERSWQQYRGSQFYVVQDFVSTLQLSIISFKIIDIPRLNQALTKIDSFQDRFIILQCVREGFQAQTESQEHMQMISDWVRDQIEQALSDVQRVEENDGAILVLVVKEFATALNIHRYGLTAAPSWKSS